MAAFAREYNLVRKKVLEVGSGRYSQYVVPDYTGLDISPSANRFYQKPFVVGSATLMQFTDYAYDSVWTIFASEHVDNPEAALNEIRRVSKDGAIIFVSLAWDVSRFAADGYPVRPYADFCLTDRCWIKVGVRLITNGLKPGTHFTDHSSDEGSLLPGPCILATASRRSMRAGE